MTVYLVAQSTPPEIVCPPWCAATQEEHHRDLEPAEGRAYHRSRDVDVDLGDGERPLTLHLFHATLADGTTEPQQHGPDGVVVCIDDHELGVETAELLVHCIESLLEQANR